MSFVWQVFPEGGSLLLLALALADYANDDGGRIYPSVATLANKVRLSKRAIQYLLRRLEKIGWLEVVSKGGGRSRTCRYRIPVGKLQTLHPLGDQPRKPSYQRVLPGVGKGAAASAPDPSVNHHVTSRKDEIASAGNARTRSASETQHVAEHLARLKATLNKSKK